MNQFAKIFGQPDQVVVGIGDFEQKQHRKFKDSVKGKGLRKVLRNAGFDLFLVDGFRTSLQCFHYHNE